jgi:transposase
MPYRIAGIDVHKKMLAVVVADVEVECEYAFERRRFGSSPDHLRLLAEWLLEQEVEEVVMESTAQYWKPVWGALERYWKPTCQKREGVGPMSGALHLAQAQSNRGPRGRKRDFPDAERLVKRLVLDLLRAIGGFASSTGSNLPQTLQPLLSHAGAPEHHGFAIDV